MMEGWIQMSHIKKGNRRRHRWGENGRAPLSNALRFGCTCNAEALSKGESWHWRQNDRLLPAVPTLSATIVKYKAANYGRFLRPERGGKTR